MAQCDLICRGPALVMATALVALSVPALARDTGSVVGTPHDLTRRFPEGGSDTCGFCHTPHQSGREGALWNVQAGPRVYGVYESPGGELRGGQPNGDSKLCLSCHDGLVAPTIRRVRTPGGSVSSVSLPAMPSGLDSDLSNDHPVSMGYGGGHSLSSQQELWPANSMPAGLGGTVDQVLLDPWGRVQCSSCHDVHDNGLGHFLVLPVEDDRLCRACHNKKDFDRSAHGPDGGPDLRDGCARCHAVHDAVEQTTLLTETQQVLCHDCHPEPAFRGPGGGSGHGSGQTFGRTALRPVTCGTCHDPHLVQRQLADERPFLSDPREKAVVPRLVPNDQVPFDATERPLEAVENRPEFCLYCHDGTWPGAMDIRSEVGSPAIRNSDFALQDRNLHAVHGSMLPGEGIGCTYCHDVHGSAGTTGMPRGALLPVWISVREFPYRGQGSCASSDPLSRCHLSARDRNLLHRPTTPGLAPISWP